jgi:hypothetical protein
MFGHLCVTPGAVGLVMVGGSGPRFDLNSASNTALSAPELMQCASGYPG